MLNKTTKTLDVKLTRGTKRIIEYTIESVGELNLMALTDFMCDYMCDKYKGESLDYQLQRMNLTTTKDIMRAIDYYIYKYY